jgi:hypothetical protein
MQRPVRSLAMAPEHAAGQVAIAANVYLASRPGVGLGVYAQRDFAPGDFLFSAMGAVAPAQTMFSIQVDWNQHLDAYPPARYLNHSCDPNAGVKTNALGLPDFYALRAIAKDEEIRYDYAMTEYRHYERARPEWDFDLTCYCGAAICRGRFGYYSELSQELKIKYRGFISDYLVHSEREARAASE